MAIIVEIKSKESCCRESQNVLTEQQMDQFMKFLKGEEGGTLGQSFRTQIVKSLIDTVLIRMFPEIKEYPKLRTVIDNTLASIDLSDLVALTGMTGNKPDACKRISEILVQGMENAIVDIITITITEKIRELAPDESDSFSPINRLLRDVINIITSGGGFATRISAGVFTENVKGSLTDEISDFICESDFADVAKSVFGSAGELIDAGLEGLSSSLKDIFSE
tara:strand:- start:58 stop:723 length:666 start_codon:yes stop_codon:yes gene_type:complete